jgi:hypothetical protein
MSSTENSDNEDVSALRLKHKRAGGRKRRRTSSASSSRSDGKDRESYQAATSQSGGSASSSASAGSSTSRDDSYQAAPPPKRKKVASKQNKAASAPRKTASAPRKAPRRRKHSDSSDSASGEDDTTDGDAKICDERLIKNGSEFALAWRKKYQRDMTPGEHLYHLGYTVVRIGTREPNVTSLRLISERIRADICSSPEFNPGAVRFDSDGAPPRLGAFGVQSVSGALHGCGTRKVLSVAIPAQRSIVEGFVAAARTEGEENYFNTPGPQWLQQEVYHVPIPDRVAVRQPHQALVSEPSHRDEYTTKKTHAKLHFGGWVSIACINTKTGEDIPQVFTCVPGSQRSAEQRATLTVGKKGKFAKMAKEESKFWEGKMEKIAVPNGYMLCFAHDMIHKVTGGKGKDLTRVFLGMAIGGPDLAPAADLTRCLDQYGPGVCANGEQLWSNYEANHASFYAYAPPRTDDSAPAGKRIKRALPCTATNKEGWGTLSEWAAHAILPKYLTVERTSIKWPGQKYKLPPRTWDEVVLWDDLTHPGKKGAPPFKVYTAEERALREPSRCVTHHS